MAKAIKNAAPHKASRLTVKSAGSRSGPRSMTGYGMAAAENGDVRLEVEIKTVNSRHLDLVFRLPRGFSELEIELRALISKTIERGRVEVSATRALKKEQPIEIRFKRSAFKKLHQTYSAVGKELGCTKEEVRRAILTQLLGRNEILEISEHSPDSSQEKSILVNAVKKSLQALDSSRAREGENMARDMRRRLQALRGTRESILKLTAQKPEQIRDRLLTSLKRLSGEVELDATRLHTEAALLADRADLTEELVRLESHLAHFDTLLANPPVGKKLDFLIQELVREFNTIGSKAQDAAIQAQVIEAKSELEKIREQVQNLE